MMDPHEHADPSPMTDSPVPALDQPAPSPTPSPAPRRPFGEPPSSGGAGFAAALLGAALAEARPRSDGERELAAVQTITRALSDLPEQSRRKVLNTVEDYVVVPPRRARQAAAAEGA